MNARLVRRGLWLLGFGCLLLPVFDDPPLATGAYVQDVTQRSAVVAMWTGQPAERALRVRDGDGREVAVTAARSRGRRHVFEVGGLEPGRRYSYAVLAGDDVCDRGSFRTAPDDDAAEVQFAVVGDSGGMPWWVWQQRSPLFYLPARWQWLAPRDEPARVGARIAQAAPDFLLHVGDVVYPRGLQAHYSAGLFRPFGDAMRHAPLYATLGNHDVMDDRGRQVLANLELPRGEVTGDERCYSFAFGPVRVIVLDCNHLLTGDEPGSSDPTLRHLRHELTTRTEPWVVVASHYPMFSASRQRDRADLLQHLLPVLEEHCVDLYFAGHDHTYQRFDPGDAPGGGVVQVVTGGGGKSLYATQHHPRVRVAVSAYHWCSVTVTGQRLVLRARSVDGDLLDTLELRQRAAGPRTEQIRRHNPGRAARIVALDE